LKAKFNAWVGKYLKKDGSIFNWEKAPAKTGQVLVVLMIINGYFKARQLTWMN